MSTPLWQFWTNWSISALGTFGTFIAVLVALFGAQLRHRFAPPRLAIKLSSTEGDPTTVYELSDTSETAINKKTEIHWFHVRVENRNRAYPATGVHIFMLMIEAPDASGIFRPIWKGDAPLRWRHEADPASKTAPKTIGYPAECDLCHIRKDTLTVEFSPINTNQLRKLLKGNFRVAVTLMARGIEGESNRHRLEISWDGRWPDDEDLMSEHFIIKQAAS